MNSPIALAKHLQFLTDSGGVQMKTDETSTESTELSASQKVALEAMKKTQSKLNFIAAFSLLPSPVPKLGISAKSSPILY